MLAQVLHIYVFCECRREMLLDSLSRLTSLCLLSFSLIVVVTCMCLILYLYNLCMTWFCFSMVYLTTKRYTYEAYCFVFLSTYE